MKYDQEGKEIIRACACARILHRGDGVVVRKLQAALARVCREYVKRRGGKDHEKILNLMGEDIAWKAEEIKKEMRKCDTAL